MPPATHIDTMVNLRRFRASNTRSVPTLGLKVCMSTSLAPEHALMTPAIRTVQRAVQVALNDQGGFAVARPLHALQLDLDPFLMIDWFSTTIDAFGPHPHAGFSAVTCFPYSTGALRNRDSLGDERLKEREQYGDRPSKSGHG